MSSLIEELDEDSFQYEKITDWQVEEKKLLAACSTKRYYRDLDLLQFSMKTLFMKLTYIDGIGYILDYEEPTHKPPRVLLKHGILAKIWSSEATRFLLIMFSINLIFKYTLPLLTYLYYAHVWLMNRKYTTARTFSEYWKSEIENSTYRLASIVNFFDPFMCNPGIFLNEGFFMVFSGVVICAINMCLTIHFNTKLRMIRVGFLGFACEPLIAREHLRKDISELIESMMDSLKSYSTFLEYLRQYKTRQDNRISLLHRSKIEHMDLSPLSTISDSKLSEFDEIINPSKIRKLLLSVQESNQVQPLVVTNYFHSKLLFLLRVIILYFEYSLLIAIVLTTSFWIALACTSRAREKIVQLNKLNSSYPQDLQGYRSYNGSYKQMIYLALLNELPKMATFSNILTLIDFGAISTFICFSQPFYFTLAWASVTSKLYWLNQIEHQLNWCLHNLKYKLDKKSSVYSTDPLTRFSIVTYLNISLFQLHFKNHAILVNLIINQSGILIGLLIWFGSLSAALISKGSSKDATLLLSVIIVYYLILINLALASNSYIVIKITRIIRIMQNFLALGAQREDYIAYIISLWRRRIPDGDEIAANYSAKFFYVNVVSNKLLLINFYMLSLLLLMWTTLTAD